VIRIIEQHDEVAAYDKIYEFRVFRAQNGSVRGCGFRVVPPKSLDMEAEAREQVAQSYLDALSLCEMEGLSIFWIHDPLGLFPPSDRPRTLEADADDWGEGSDHISSTKESLPL
jgi:hypothetical protein